MSVTVTINTAEFIEELIAIPQGLAREGAQIVHRSAVAVAQRVSARYARVSKTGNLEKGIRVVNWGAGPFNVAAVVKSTAPHNYLYENGTQGKIRYFGKASRGPMPGAHIFIPTAIRERKAMQMELVKMVEKAGFKVTHG